MIAIIVICLLAVMGTALAGYLWRRPPVGNPDSELTPPRSAGLFSSQATSVSPVETAAIERSEIRARLLDRARKDDPLVLSDASSIKDSTLYNEVLNTLTDSASDNREKLHDLASYISGNSELRANKRLAENVIKTWEAAADRRSTVEMMHIAALSDDAATYQGAVELVISFWQKGKLIDFKTEDLLELFESQFWILAPEARKGGAGFALKQRLAGVRRELATTTPAGR